MEEQLRKEPATEAVEAGKKARWMGPAIVLGMLLLLTLVFCHYGKQKYLTFWDEIYTFILANSDNEFLTYQLEAGRWYENGETVSILTSKGHFAFRQVMLNNKGDVHPPMYYFVIHFLSVISGSNRLEVIGLVANWLFAAISLCGLLYLTYQLTRNYWIMGGVGLMYLTSTAVISMNMLLRMYGMFSMCVTWFLVALFWIYQGKKKLWNYILIAGITFVGFLTQYYFAVICVLLSACYCLYCLIKKHWKDLLFYIGSMIVALFAATVFWRTWIRHMFSGYLGGAVMENAFNFSKILDDFKYGIIHLYTMRYGALGWLAGLIVIVAVVFLFLKKDKRVWFVLTPIGSAIVYSIAIVHLTPMHLLSYRYFYPVTVMAYLGELMAVYYAISLIWEKAAKIALPVVCVLCSVYFFVCPLMDKDCISYVDLRGKQADAMETLQENHELPWLYFGYENAIMAELFYDSAVSDRFMMVNYDVPFTDENYTRKNGEFLLFAEEMTAYETDAKSYCEEWFAGELTFTPLTHVGDMIVYKVTHVVK